MAGAARKGKIDAVIEFCIVAHIICAKPVPLPGADNMKPAFAGFILSYQHRQKLNKRIKRSASHGL